MVSSRGIIRNLINIAIREKGTQAVVAEEAGCDGASLSKFLSGDGSLKLDVIERIVVISGMRVMSETHYQDLLAALRAMNRLWIDEN